MLSFHFMVLTQPSLFEITRINKSLAVKVTKLWNSILTQKIKNSSAWSQATTSNRANILAFTTLVSEERANGHWEPSNRRCFSSSHNRMFLASEFHLLFHYLLTTVRPRYPLPSGLGQSTTVGVQVFKLYKIISITMSVFCLFCVEKFMK
jgi:hypothetical protein